MAHRPSLIDLLSEEEIAALVHEDFGLFVQTMYRSTRSAEPLVWAPYLDLLCSRLEDIAHGRRRHLIITLPPRSLKTFCVSICLPAFVLGHYPNQEILCVSYGQELARELGAHCQSLMQSQAYVDVFGSVLAGSRLPAHRLVTYAGGVRRATSLDGVATGIGGHLMIFDDLQKAGETLSEAIRRASNQQFENTFLSRRNLSGSARMVIVMQRLHEDDFVGHVLGLGGDWEVLNLPAISEEDQRIPFRTALGSHVYRRNIGEALHPARVSLQELELTRRAVGEAVFASQYQQRPAPAGGGLVKTAWFQHYDPSQGPDKFDRIVQSWDTAYTRSKSSDFSCCTTWGVKGKQIYLLHVFRDRLEYHQLRKKLVEHAGLHGASTVLVEDKGSGISLVQDLRASNFGIVRPVKVTADKQTRMINQTVLIENGFVYVPNEAPWLEEYLHELSVFPNGRHDDQVDSTSQALEGMSQWTQGAGVFEYYRQIAATKVAEQSEVWVLIPPPAVSVVYDQDGVEHRLQPDGAFHLKRAHAVTLVNQIGWRRGS